MDALIDVGEFTDLADPTTARIVRESVARHRLAPDAVWECIIDNPAAANWRLRPHPQDPSRVRLACFRFTPTDGDQAREQRVSDALSRIP